MKRGLTAAILMMTLELAAARPVLPPAGFDALYPAYLPLPPDRVLIFGGEGADAKANDLIFELKYSRPTASASWTARGVLAVPRREPEIAVFPGTSAVAIVTGEAPKTMQRPRIGNVLAFLDGALITVFGQNTMSPTSFAGLDIPE